MEEGDDGPLSFPLMTASHLAHGSRGASPLVAGRRRVLLLVACLPPGLRPRLPPRRRRFPLSQEEGSPAERRGAEAPAAGEPRRRPLRASVTRG